MTILKTLALFGVAIILNACGEKPAENTQTTPVVDTVTAAPAPTETSEQASQRKFDGYSDDFKKLMLSFKGDIREMPLYIKKDELKTKETAQLVEDKNDKMLYKLELNQTEHATITYGFANNELKTISIVVKIDTQEDYGKLEAELIDFFTHKFGQADELADKGEVWNIQGKHQIDIIDRSTKTEFKLEVDIQ